jgi:hypothetical protein
VRSCWPWATSPSLAPAGYLAGGIPFTWGRPAVALQANGWSSPSPPTTSPAACDRLGRKGGVHADTPLAADRILSVLAEHEVEHVIVGGLAVQTHGHVRTTVDIDIYPRPTPANLARLAAALNALDAEVLNPGADGMPIDATTLPRATLWQFTTRHGGLDVIHDAPGAPPYEELRARALEIRLGDLELAVAGLDDLISMKRASGRPVDLEDVAALTEPDAQRQPES